MYLISLDAGIAANPLFVIFALGSYLYFVKNCGPNFMKNREPYGLRSVMLWYNGLQVVFNTWLSLYVSLPKCYVMRCYKLFIVSEYSCFADSNKW